jgi:hypothetical protein
LEQPLVNKKYVLEKFPAKGGWTFVRIPDIMRNKKAPFGWKKVKGTIDGYEIKKYHLMSMGEGKLFLPVKGEIRKKIKKQEGDTVHIILYPDTDPFEVPEEMMLCLQDEPEALAFFNSISESERTFYIQYIYSAKREETKIDRLAKTINKLLKGLKMYEKES